MKKLAVLGLLTIMTASCAVPEASAPPELVLPVSVQADTARVGRGNVATMEQYKGAVRVKSDKLYFEETGLYFGDFYCMPGQTVKQGDLLARLDTEWVEEEIEAQTQRLSRTRQEHDLENRRQELDIAIAQIELQGLTQAAADYDESAMAAAEDKRLEITRRNMELTQTKERQALSLKYEEENLRELKARLAKSALYAPYDGKITYMASLSPGSSVEPYEPLMFISNEQEMLVEYTGMVSVTVSRGDIIKGQIGEKLYDMERITLSQQDALYYNTLRLTAPLRFNIVNPDESVKPGAYVSILVYSSIVEDVLRIPVNAMYSDTEIGTYVYVKEDGQKVMRPIENGLRSISYVEVISGLDEGDEVYVQ